MQATELMIRCLDNAGVEFTNPDLVRYAEAFGRPGFRVERMEDLRPVLRRALAA